MGLRFHKSINCGCFRINFSKSGVGASVGIPGFRYTVTANGQERVTVSVPGSGISYVENVTAAKMNAGNDRTAAERQKAEEKRNAAEIEHARATGNYETIRNADVSSMQPVEYRQFIAECQRWLDAWNNNRKLLIFGGIGTVLLLLILRIFVNSPILFGIMGAIAAIICTVAGSNMYSLKKDRINAEYIFEATPNPYADLQDLFDKTQHPEKMWFTESIASNIESRRHAGADSLSTLREFKIIEKKPPFLNTNIRCYCINLTNEELFILPDKIIVVSGGKIGAINTGSVTIGYGCNNFRESGAVPSDAVILAYSWEKVNKDGSPDKRFKDNRQIPICRYGDMRITSPEGLNILIKTSNYEKSYKFYCKWLEIKNPQK